MFIRLIDSSLYAAFSPPSSADMLSIQPLLAVVTLALLPFVANAYPNPGKVTGDTAVHDPTMCKDSSGTYFVFSTGTGIQILTSTDRTAWTNRGVVFDNPTWTDAYTGTSNG